MNQENPDSFKLIAGDASDRKFYRVQEAGQSLICMEFPKWEGGYGGDPLSWLGMHSALAAIGMPVPKVVRVEEERARIWTEDFGDSFLNHALRRDVLDLEDPLCAETIRFYRESLDLLIDAQYPKTPLPEHPALDRHFDFEKLHFEMDFFRKHFLSNWLGLDLGGAEWKSFANALDADFRELCRWLDGRERVLCHRDYHVRNVMMKDGHPHWIDFQDARMGPHSYDVVSLVRDSYVRISWPTRFSLMRYYLDGVNRRRLQAGRPSLGWGEFCTESLCMGLQRNIKALGSFGYLATQKGKPGYLNYVRQTIEVLASPEARACEGFSLAQRLPGLDSLISELSLGRLSNLINQALGLSNA